MCVCQCVVMMCNHFSPKQEVKNSLAKFKFDFRNRNFHLRSICLFAFFSVPSNAISMFSWRRKTPFLVISKCNFVCIESRQTKCEWKSNKTSQKRCAVRSVNFIVSVFFFKFSFFATLFFSMLLLRHCVTLVCVTFKMMVFSVSLVLD